MRGGAGLRGLRPAADWVGDDDDEVGRRDQFADRDSTVRGSNDQRTTVQLGRISPDLRPALQAGTSVQSSGHEFAGLRDDSPSFVGCQGRHIEASPGVLGNI